MNSVFLLGTLLLAYGCSIPCTTLNENLVAFYNDCGVTIPTDLEDGGKGDCGTDEVGASCTMDCYDAAGCASIDGTSTEAETTLSDCTVLCEQRWPATVALSAIELLQAPAGGPDLRQTALGLLERAALAAPGLTEGLVTLHRAQPGWVAQHAVPLAQTQPWAWKLVLDLVRSEGRDVLVASADRLARQGLISDDELAQGARGAGG